MAFELIGSNGGLCGAIGGFLCCVSGALLYCVDCVFLNCVAGVFLYCVSDGLYCVGGGTLALEVDPLVRGDRPIRPNLLVGACDKYTSSSCEGDDPHLRLIDLLFVGGIVVRSGRGAISMCILLVRVSSASGSSGLCRPLVFGEGGFWSNEVKHSLKKLQSGLFGVKPEVDLGVLPPRAGNPWSSRGEK